MHAEIFDVDGASETGIEEQVPAGAMIVIVYIDAVTVPSPIAAAIEVVGGNHPIRIVVEHHAPQAEIDAPRDEYFSHVSIAPVRIRPPRPDAVVIVIPIPVVIAIRLFVPALVLSVVMAGARVPPGFLLFPSLFLPLCVVVVLVLSGGGGGQRFSLNHE